MKWLDLGKDIWLEWREPYWLLLLIPIFLGFFFRYSPYYIQKAHQHLKSRGRIRTKIRFAPPLFFAFLMMLSMTFAAADVTRGYVAAVGKLAVHRIFVWVDSSSSMRWVTTARVSHGSIKCGSPHVRFYLRIHGACRALERLIDEVSRNAEKKKSFTERDLVGIGQFALNSYVISYPSNDYRRLQEKVKNMEFVSSDLGIFTNVHLGVWDMYLMALERNLRQGSGYADLSGKELRRLASSLAPGGSEKEYEPPRELREKLLKIREELRDTVFIIITDATLGQMDATLGAGPTSLRKQLQLAAFLGLPMFFFSTDEFHIELKRLTRLTGFGPAGGPYRGDFLTVKKEQDLYNIGEAVSNMLQSRFTLTTPSREERRESYSEWLVLAALTFGAVAVILQKTVARSLTDL